MNYKTNSKPNQQIQKIINSLNKLNKVNTNAKLVLVIVFKLFLKFSS